SNDQTSSLDEERVPRSRPFQSRTAHGEPAARSATAQATGGVDLEYEGRDGSWHDFWTQSLASIERNSCPEAERCMRSQVGDNGPDEVEDVRPSDLLPEGSEARNLDLDRTIDEQRLPYHVGGQGERTPGTYPHAEPVSPAASVGGGCID